MSKSKVQSLITLIISGSQILHTVFSRHGAPDLVSLAVPLHIVHLGGNDYNNIPGHDPEESLISGVVIRFIIVAVYL